MKVLITGAAGFIGSHIAERFRDVIGIDNLSTGRRANFEGDLIVGDIADDDAMLFAEPDVIYHCAASYRDRGAWEQDARTNVQGTINVVRLAQRTGAKLVYFQTSLCYGPKPASPVTVDAPLDPHGSYAVSKTAAEAYIRDSGIDYVSLRLANIYGPRNLSGPVPTFWKRLDESQPVTVVDSRRDFVYISDLVRLAFEMAFEGHGVYHVSSGRDYAIADLYAAVAAAMGRDDPAPEPQPRGPDDVATILIDPSETEHAFAWKATTPLAEGVAEAVRWYEANGVTDTYTHLSVKG